MNWIRANWRWAALNLGALTVMVVLLAQFVANSHYVPDYNPTLVNSGKWAIRFLLISLAMTPLNTLLGWRAGIKLRKPAGLWAFAFGITHFLFYVAAVEGTWLQYPIPDSYTALGVAGLLILTAMAATSTRWAMRQLGRWWKRLHRLVYAAGILVVVHALLETSGKRVATVDPQANIEVSIYILLLTLLLAARLPAVRSALGNWRQRRRPSRTAAARG